MASECLYRLAAYEKDIKWWKTKQWKQFGGIFKLISHKINSDAIFCLLLLIVDNQPEIYCIMILTSHDITDPRTV